MHDMRTFAKVMQVAFGIGSKHCPKLPTSLLNRAPVIVFRFG